MIVKTHLLGLESTKNRLVTLCGHRAKREHIAAKAEQATCVACIRAARNLMR